MKRILSVLTLCLAVTTLAYGHGSMLQPISRVYTIFLENPQNPKLPSSQAAVAARGTQPFYDWHEVNNLVPQRNYQELIPDGTLPGAGRDKYAGLNLTRTDWPSTEVSPGPYQCVFDAPTPHNPNTFTAYLTKEGYDPSQPLKWSDLVEIPISNFYQDGNYYKFVVDFPQRTGRHVLYVIWQRIDPAGEAFFSTSDLIFTDGASNPPPEENPLINADPQDLNQGDHQLVATNDWGSGFIGAASVTNTTGAPLNGWTLCFTLDREIVNIWDAVLVERQGNRYVITNEAWNGNIPNQGKINFGFEAHGGNGNVQMTDVTLVNGTTSNISDPVCACCTNKGDGGGSGGGSTGGGGTGGGGGDGGTNSPLPLLTVTGIDVTEGNGAQSVAEFILNLSEPATGNESLLAKTQDGTATGGQDYTAAEFDVAFQPGETQVRVPVAIIGDVLDEEDENFTLQLSNAQNVELERTSALAVIRDEDEPATGGGGNTGGGSGGGDGGNTGGGSGGSGGSTGGGGSGETAAAELIFLTTNDWGSGFQAAAQFINKGEALSGWTLTFEVPYEITQMWNAKIISRQGNRYTIQNEHWNGNVPTGGRVDFGFLGRAGGNTPDPENVTLNGKPIQ